VEEDHASNHANILVFTYNEISSKKIRLNCKIIFIIIKHNFLE
jgi:hypothetical protein